MPIYDYECKCGHEFESLESKDMPRKKCPECGKIAKRVLPKNPPQVHMYHSPMNPRRGRGRGLRGRNLKEESKHKKGNK